MAVRVNQKESPQLLKKELVLLFFLLFLYLSTGLQSVHGQDSSHLASETLSTLVTPETAESASYSDEFAEIIGESELGFILYDLDGDELLAAVNAQEQLPVASAFKGPVALYFFNQVPPEYWSVPVEYWHNDPNQPIDEAHQEAWAQHGAILHDMFLMITKSDNPATGNVLNFVAQFAAAGTQNPIESFNAWSENTVGTTPESGLYSWTEGATNEDGYIDERFSPENRMANLYGRDVFVPNTMTATDLAQYYYWMFHSMDAAQRASAEALLSIVPPLGSGTWIETLPLRLDPQNGTSYSKSGIVSDHGWLVDAGIIFTPEHGHYLIIAQGTGAGDKFAPLYQEIQNVIMER